MLPLTFDCLVEIFFGKDWSVRVFVPAEGAVVLRIEVRFCGSCRRDLRGAARAVEARRREARKANESFIIICICEYGQSKAQMNDLIE